jgi:hypothetical protein
MIKPLIFDVSGVHGTVSGDAWGCSDGAEGQRGTNAGTIAVRLTTPTTTADIPKNVVLPNPIDVNVKLDASIVSTTGRQERMDTKLKINSGESMCFLALGGHGGNGGNGGNGERGLQGARYGAFLVLSLVNEFTSEYAWRTEGGIWAVTIMVLIL